MDLNLHTSLLKRVPSERGRDSSLGGFFWLCCLKVLRNLLCLPLAQFPGLWYWVGAPLKSATGVKMTSVDQAVEQYQFIAMFTISNKTYWGCSSFHGGLAKELPSCLTQPLCRCSSVSRSVAAAIRSNYSPLLQLQTESNEHLSPAPATSCFYVNQAGAV